MRFLRAVLGGLVGAVPGIALVPVLEFFAMVLIVLGMIGGAMVGAAPEGRRKATALGAILGFLAGGVLALLPGRFGFLLAPVAVVYGGLVGMRGVHRGTRPAAQA